MATEKEHDLRNHLHQGDTLRDAGRLQEAEVEYRAALEMDSANSDACYKLFILYLEMGKVEEGLQELDFLSTDRLPLPLENPERLEEKNVETSSEGSNKLSLAAPDPLGSHLDVQETEKREEFGTLSDQSSVVDIVENPLLVEEAIDREERSIKDSKEPEDSQKRAPEERISIPPPEIVMKKGMDPQTSKNPWRYWLQGAFVGGILGALLGFGLVFFFEYPYQIGQLVIQGFIDINQKSSALEEEQRLAEVRQHLEAERRQLEAQRQQFIDNQRQFAEQKRLAEEHRRVEQARHEETERRRLEAQQQLTALKEKLSAVEAEKAALEQQLQAVQKEKPSKKSRR